MKHDLEKNRGSALILAVVLLLIFGLGSAVAWRALHLELKGAQDQRRLDKAFYLAEAGLERAIASLQANSAYAGETATALADGFFTVQVAPAGEGERIREQVLPGTYQVTSEGYLDPAASRKQRITLVATLRLGAGGRVLAYQFQRRRDTL